MQGLKIRSVGGLAAVLLVAASPAFGQDSASISGVIIRHNGSTIVVRGSGGDMPVVLSPSTRIYSTTGALRRKGSDYPPSDLVRGLHVEVTGEHMGDHLTASAVTFKKGDLKTARQIAGGMVITDEQVERNREGIAENSGRIDNVGMLQAAGRTKVFFAVGSTKITAQGQQDLQALAAHAKGLKGAYRLAVVGRADPTGNAAANQRLSEARAAAVTGYLMQSAGILPGDFLPPAAVGAAAVAQDPDPPANDAEARRVTFTFAVSKTNRGRP
jgi:outer membrane protein OmpA-like peptidoglycan-associated protein